jgi:hypothetical protein
MNLKLKPDNADKTALPVVNAEASTKGGIPKRFRRLKWDELVSRGDFVVDERLEYKPWEGPNGFRADSFVKPIYRQFTSRCTATKT